MRTSSLRHWFRRARLQLGPSKILFAAALLVIVVIELLFAPLRISYWDSYTGVVYRKINVIRENNATRIALVIIVYSDKKKQNYQLATDSINCYAKLHNYEIIRVNLKSQLQFDGECRLGDLMFKRHCVMARLMEDRPLIQWFLFLDADMGVINPSHLIEEYLPANSDLVFYDRLFDYEIMAGSYFARNTEFSRKFLRDWAKYEGKVDPRSFHGTDNGAIQEVVLDYFCGDCSPRLREECSRIYGLSRDYEGLFLYESCARTILGARSHYTSKDGNMTIRTNAEGYWARDGWQTRSRWSSADFILHGWQSDRLNRNVFAGWLNPFTSDAFAQMDKCSDPTVAHMNWAYKDAMMVDVEWTEKRLREVFRQNFIWSKQNMIAVAKGWPLH